jgi:very-short-patch-repair endonuclease
VLHVTCGIDVVPQHPVIDADGRQVARADLWLVGSRVLHEYDGAVHRDPAAHARDLRRDRALLTAGWTRRGYVADDVVARSVAVLRDADSTVGRDHRPERIRPWLRLLAGSLVTPSGQATLRTRLELDVNRRAS